MKNPKQQSPIWPYLGILAFLFLLSLTAPRAWQRDARREVGRVTTTPQSDEGEPYVDFPLDDPADDENCFEPTVPEAVFSRIAETPSADAAQSADPVIPPAPEIVEESPQDARTEPDAQSVGELDGEPQIAAPDEQPVPDPEATQQVAYGWPLPRVLIEQLTTLVHEDAQLLWAQRSLELVHRLCQDPTNRDAAQDALTKLREVVERDALAPPADPSLAGDVIRVRYALARWLDIWTAAAALADVPLEKRTAGSSPDKILLLLTDFDALAKQSPAGAAWREYLKLPALAEAAAEGTSDRARRAAARAVLDRLTSSRLSPAQRRFVSQDPLAILARELRPWAAEPVTPERLLAHLDQYEYSRLTSDARLVADDLRALSWSSPEEADKLNDRLDMHYRNANVRVAVSAQLVDRILPQPQRLDERVRDTVVNVPVRGRATTFTRLSIKLVPDPRRIRLGLEARGTVDSNTFASSGPATFHNTGQSTFLVRKLFVLGPRGLTVWPAIAEAENNYNYLISMETNFDGVPLVGSLVRTIARKGHDESRGEAGRETAQKVAIRALRQLDTEADARITEATKNLEKDQLATLRRLGLELTPVALSTSHERVVARARLSSHQQLGGHTPRPRAPSDCWFSWQTHESALNNGLAGLDLEGRSFELPQLFEFLAEKLGRPELAKQEDLPEDVALTFADADPVRLRCDDGQVELTINLAELKHAGSRWRNFQVRTRYSPEAEGLSPRFVRHDTIHLAGRSLKGKLEIKLRAIFSRVLSKNREIKLLGESITEDPRMQDLQVTQFSVVDGWIALAYSPARPGNRVARKPE
jgi:hypothetical protein